MLKKSHWNKIIDRGYKKRKRNCSSLNLFSSHGNLLQHFSILISLYLSLKLASWSLVLPISIQPLPFSWKSAMAAVREYTVKRFWSKLFVILESLESLIPMRFTRNCDVIMVVNQKKVVIFNLYKNTQSCSKKENIHKSSWKCQA